jgi:hypothetical protein
LGLLLIFVLDRISILTKKKQNNNKGANPTQLEKANKTHLTQSNKQENRKIHHRIEAKRICPQNLNKK